MTVMDALSRALLHRGWMLATAESCTGGLIAARCTDLAGSSQWFERGFVTYSNDAKHAERLNSATCCFLKSATCGGVVVK